MITGLVLQFLALLASALLGVMPSVPVPSWLTAQSGPLGTVFADLTSMGVWFPVGLMTTVLAAYFAIKLVGFGIKVARIAASFMTGGGGSAA